jgi:hypothetical protein
MATEFDLDADESKLVAAFEASIRKAVALEGQLEKLTDRIGKLEASNKKLSDTTKKSTVDLGKAAQALGVLHPALGNAARNADDLVQGMGALGSTLGPVTLAVGALAVGAAGLLAAELSLVAGMIQLGSAAGEAGSRIEDLGLLTEEQAALADDLARSTEASADATDALTVKVAAAVPYMGDLVAATTGAKVVLGLLFDELERVGIGLQAVQTINPGTVAALERLAGVGRASAAASDAMAASVKAAAENNKQVEKEVADLVDSILDQLGDKEVEVQEERTAAAEKGADDRRKAEEKAAKDAKKLAEDAKKRDADFNEYRLDLWLGTLNEQAAALKAYGDKIVAEQERQTEEWIAAQEQMREDAITNWTGLADTAVSSIDQVTQAFVASQQEQIDAEIAKSQQSEDGYRAMLARGEGLNQEQRQWIRDQIAAEDDKQAEFDRQRRKAAIAAKAVAITSALIQGGLATINAFATVPWPAAPFVAAGVGVQTAATIGVMAGQQFHDGGEIGRGQGPDEFDAGGGNTGRAGERAVVFNQRAVESGAVQRAAAENRGAAGASAGNRAGVVVMDGRTIGEVLIRERNKANSPLAVGRPDGVTNPFRRAR